MIPVFRLPFPSFHVQASEVIIIIYDQLRIKFTLMGDAGNETGRGNNVRDRSERASSRTHGPSTLQKPLLLIVS